jgi:hypothetical protein
MVRSIFSTGQVPLLEKTLNQGLSSSREFMVRCAAHAVKGLRANYASSRQTMSVKPATQAWLSFGAHDPAYCCPREKDICDMWQSTAAATRAQQQRQAA